MKPTVHIHRNRLIWVHKGQRIPLSLSEAKNLNVELLEWISELECRLSTEMEAFKPIVAIDTALRSSAPLPYWMNHVQLEYGVYEPIDSIVDWSEFWSSVRSLDRETLARLVHRGTFDELFKLDGSLLTVQDDGILSSRLRQLSESMEWVGACSFDMGDDSLEAWDFEQPIHTVQLTEGFWIGSVPVTQQLFWSIMGYLPEMPTDLQGALKPVVQVHWFEALVFCNQLSVATDREPVYWVESEMLTKDNLPLKVSDVRYDLVANGYRLPSEAEWECAAKAFQPFQFSGSEDINAVAWTASNSERVLPRVGMKAPNALGLYDMSGLVWEWCWDGYDSTFYERSPDSDPISFTDDGGRVCRGGSFTGDEINSRVTLRGRAPATEGWDSLGFRIVCKD